MKSHDVDSRLNVIFGRRSIRRYTDEPVDDKTVRLLLEAAMSAPSAVAKDPWRFVVLKSAETRKRISEGLPNGKMLAGAPLGFVVCGDLEAAHGGLEGYMVQDCSAAMENLLLAAHSLGLGACWLGVYPRKERQDHVAGVLGLPETIYPLGAVAVGYPAETKPSRTRYDASHVHYDVW